MGSLVLAASLNWLTLPSQLRRHSTLLPSLQRASSFLPRSPAALARGRCCMHAALGGGDAWVVCRGQREGSAASRQGYGRARSWTSRCSGEHVLPVARICAAPSTQATTTLFVQTLSPTEWRRDARAWGVRSEDRPSQLDTVWVDAEVPFTEAERVAVQETWTQVMSSCRDPTHKPLVGSFLSHLARGNPSDYRLAVRKGQMMVAQEDRPARPIRTGAFVRRFWALFVLPPSTGPLRLSDLAATASEQALAPSTLPNTFAADVAECFAAAAPVLDMFEHSILQGAAMRSTYHDMAIYNCMTRALGVQLYEWNEDVVRLLRIERDGKLVGRALLWETEQGYTLMDRVHPDNTGAHVRYAYAVAAREGWRTRPPVDDAHEACMSLQESHLLYRLCCFFQRLGGGAARAATIQEEAVSVRLRVAHHYPVFDTFKYASWPSKEDPSFRLTTRREKGMVQPDALWADACCRVAPRRR